MRQARQVAQQFPHVQCVCVGDSESDIYRLFAEPRGEASVHWLIRACQERPVEDPDGLEKVMRDCVMASPLLFTKEIAVRGRRAKTECETRTRRESRETRKATVEVRATCVTLRPPVNRDRPLPSVSVNVVLVRESNPPKGKDPIEWILLTTLPISTVDEVREIIQYYCVRWLIEVCQAETPCRLGSR